MSRLCPLDLVSVKTNVKALLIGGGVKSGADMHRCNFIFMRGEWRQSSFIKLHGAFLCLKRYGHYSWSLVTNWDLV